MNNRRFWTLLPLLLYQLSTYALVWIPFVPRYVVLGLPLLAANLVFALALFSPARRAWGRRMLLASAFLLALAVLYASFPGLPVSARSSVKLVGPEGGQVMTPDRMARAVVQTASFPVPLLLKVASLPLSTPLPGPTLPPRSSSSPPPASNKATPSPKNGRTSSSPKFSSASRTPSPP